MNIEELLAQVMETLKGIDETELESEYGWWETSTGADNGARTLEELETLLRTAWTKHFDGSTVPMPANEQMARAMVLLGMKWLEDNGKKA